MPFATQEGSVPQRSRVELTEAPPKPEGPPVDDETAENATMHLDQKYTNEEATHIFDLVGGLMKRIASRCDEIGEPKA